jgi:hypothetical protein
MTAQPDFEYKDGMEPDNPGSMIFASNCVGLTDEAIIAGLRLEIIALQEYEWFRRDHSTLT